MMKINDEELVKNTATEMVAEKDLDVLGLAMALAKEIEKKQNDEDVFESMNLLINMLDKNKEMNSLEDTPYIMCNCFLMGKIGEKVVIWSQLTDISMEMSAELGFKECKKTYVFNTDDNLLGHKIDKGKYPLIIVGKKQESLGRSFHYEYPWILCESKEEYKKIPENIEIMGVFSVKDDLYDTMMKKINIAKEKMEA